MTTENQPKIEGEEPTPVFNLDEGTFYEKVMSPTKLTILDNEGERVAILEDQNGEKMTIAGNQVVHRLLQVFVNQLPQIEDKQTAHMWQKSDKNISSILTKAFKDRVKSIPEKPPTVKFLIDDEGKVYGATSTLHKQIPWSKIKTIVQQATEKAYGITPTLEISDARWDYQIPIESQNVSAWAEIEKGTNIGMGRAGIQIHGRFRTESRDFGMANPCHNWASLWNEALGFFDVKEKGIFSILENAQDLSTRHVHMRGTFNDDTAIEELTQSLLAMQDSAVAFDKAIENSRHIPLSYKEMEAILNAYDEKIHLPKYAFLDIIERAKEQDEETVYAFSQAISWIRTHGELRSRGEETNREGLTLTRKLENMAGEMYYLAPTIQNFHEKIGDITFDKLIEKPKRVRMVMVATTGAQITEAPETVTITQEDVGTISGLGLLPAMEEPEQEINEDEILADQPFNEEDEDLGLPEDLEADEDGFDEAV